LYVEVFSLVACNHLQRSDGSLGLCCSQLVCGPLYGLQCGTRRSASTHYTTCAKIVKDRDSLAIVVTGSLLSTWIYRLSYILDLCLIKTSILLFYDYIASTRKSFHLTVRILLAINLLGSSSMIVASVFTCYPISDSWSFRVLELSFQGVRENQCYNPSPFWIANASYNLITDVVIW
jgi:hypothetical protein